MHKINRCATRRTNQRMENIIKSTSKVYHTDIIWQWTHLDNLQSHFGGENKTDKHGNVSQLFPLPNHL